MSLLLLFMMCLPHDGVVCDWMSFPLLCLDSCISNTQSSRSTYVCLCSSILFCLSQSTAAVWEDEEDVEFFDEAKCESEGEAIEQCVKDEVDKGNIDTAWASSLEKALLTAEPCAQQAVAEGDADKVVKCALPVLDITDKYCSTAAFREACGMTPSMFADFVLDLAEVLEVGEDGYGLRGSSFGEE